MRMSSVNSTSVKEQKKFTCELCERTFIRKANLTQHKVMHDPEKKFICEFCEKTFNRKVNFIQHKVTHDLARKIYSCHICQKKFSSKIAKTKHVKKEHVAYEVRSAQCKRMQTSSGSFAEFEIIPEVTSKDLNSFLIEAKSHVCEIVKEEVKQNRATVVQYILSVLMSQNGVEVPVHFASETYKNKGFDKALQKIKDSFEEYMESGVNWQLVRIIRLNVCSLNCTQF